MGYYLLIFYLVGLFQEFLAALYLRFLTKGKTIPAVALSFTITLIGLLVIFNILTRLETQKGTIAIIVFALGVATGTFLAMKVKKGFKN